MCLVFASGENAHAVRSAVINALGALTGADLWEQVQHCSDMFDSGGFYYIKAVSDLGQLQPNQHCTLPGLPNKVWVTAACAGYQLTVELL